MRLFTAITIKNLLIIVFLLSPSLGISKRNNNFIEYTHSLDVSTFHSIKSIGLFAAGKTKRNEVLYGGLQLSQFVLKNNNISSNLYSVLIGVALEGKISPFIEVGTDLLGLFIAGNKEQANCSEDDYCNNDGFFKIGVRFSINKEFALGIYNQSIAFGQHHSRLKDDHNYTGASLAYSF